MANFDWVRQPHGITKIVLLFLTTTALGLWIKYKWFVVSESEGALYLSVVTMSGNLVMVFYIILAKIIDGASGKMTFTIIVFDIIHAILSVAVAGCGLNRDTIEKSPDGSKAGLAFVILSALVMLIDAFLEYRKRN